MPKKQDPIDAEADIRAITEAIRRIASPEVRYFLTMLADAVAAELSSIPVNHRKED